MSKIVALMLLAILALSSLVIVGSAFAQSIPTPSVPEFTLKVVAHPFDVPPTYEEDPYTGEQVLTERGYHVENKSIEVTIKNQPFSSYVDVNGNSIGLYYNITVKGHYEDAWDYCFSNPYRGLLNASGSDYTIISMPIGYHVTVPLGGYPLEGVDVGDQVDFRVQAQIGYYNKSYTGMFAPVPGGDFYYIFTGESSGWSETQTLAIPESPSPSPEPTPTPTEEPQQTGQDVTAGAILALTSIVVFLGLLVFFIKKR